MMTAITERLSAALAGRYRIERELGAGGMATVYLAEDLKHKRKVALKVLKPELAAVLGAERFVQEITTTASLQHPHILALFDSGTADGFLFYVMPWIQGETLREKLNRETQFGVDEAVRIAREVADALEYAHQHGIVHRDIKPENILLHGGHAMVADFGIALAVSAAAGGRMTETGLSLGTPHYMSPEQATAEKEITARSDVYSLGSVLFEMLAGQPPHLGGSAQQIIMKIIAEPVPAVTALRKSVPPNVAAAVAKSLEKLPADRFESAKAFGDALGNPAYTNAAGTGAAAGAYGGEARVLKRRFIGMSVLAAVALAALAWMAIDRRGAPAAIDGPVLRLQLVLPKGQTINDGLATRPIGISPQGDRIAYVASTPTSGGQVLWLRPTDQLESRPLTTLGGALRSPSFSPDGRWVAYTEGNDIKKVSVDGGPVVTLATVPDSPYGLSWGTDGLLVAGSGSFGLWVIPEHGGAARLLPKLSDETTNRWPLFLPDGKTIVYMSGRAGGLGAARLAVVSVADAKRAALDVPGVSPLALLHGHLVYVTQTGVVMAVPFDGHRVTLGDPMPLLQDVVTDNLGGAKAALSATGTLVYRSGKSENQPVIVHGATTPLIDKAGNFSTPRFSPDGKRVAFTVTSSGAMDVWVYDRARSTLTKVTSEGLNQRPEWSPDGKRLVFVSDRGGKSAVWSQPADVSAPAELLYEPNEGDPYEAVLSHDGHWLVYRTGPGGRPPRNIFAVALDGDHKAIPVVTGKSQIEMPRLSPDGHWLAYQSTESGTFEIYVRPFPGPGGRVQVSTGGGTEPLWAQSGRALFYRNGLDVVSVGVTLGASLGIGERKVVLTGDFLPNSSHPNYDVSPDGSEFLMLRRTGDEVLTVVVHNWIRELVAKTAGKK
jgi:Tol biopolymer transport system component/tRNA A-37 threonylcarbamoyl transferase component Bud32